MQTETRLSLVSLQRMGACDAAKHAFENQFPQGATLREVILALVDHPQGIEWFEWLATRMPKLRPLWEQYESAKHPLREQYESAERSLWEQYAAAVRPLREQYYAAVRPLLEQYEAAKRPLLEQYNAAERPLLAQYNAAVRSSLRVIAETFPPSPK